MKPTPFQLECILDAACESCAEKAREYELDAIRHEHFANSPAATNRIGPQKTRAELRTEALKEGAKYRRLAEAAREMREAAHEHNFAFLMAQAEKIEIEGTLHRDIDRDDAHRRDDAREGGEDLRGHVANL